MEYVWDHTLIPGSTRAIIKVIAYDGLSEGCGTSHPFYFPHKKPQITIVSPPDGITFPEDTPIHLTGGS